jgi:hypothetical protein
MTPRFAAERSPIIKNLLCGNSKGAVNQRSLQVIVIVGRHRALIDASTSAA